MRRRPSRGEGFEFGPLQNELRPGQVVGLVDGPFETALGVFIRNQQTLVPEVPKACADPFQDGSSQALVIPIHLPFGHNVLCEEFAGQRRLRVPQAAEANPGDLALVIPSLSNADSRGGFPRAA